TAVAFTAIAALTFWALAERRHADNWRAEYQRQAQLVEKSQAEAERQRKETELQHDEAANQRTEAIRYKTAAEAAEKELETLRALANAPVLTPLPAGPIPFIPVGNANGKRSWGP